MASTTGPAASKPTAATAPSSTKPAPSTPSTTPSATSSTSSTPSTTSSKSSSTPSATSSKPPPAFALPNIPPLPKALQELAMAEAMSILLGGGAGGGGGGGASDDSDGSIERRNVKLVEEVEFDDLGAVWRGTYRGRPVRVIVMKRDDSVSGRSSAVFEALFLAMRCKALAPHRNVLQFVGVNFDEAGGILVTEATPSTDSLHDVLVAYPRLDVRTRLSIVLQIAEGMAHLHGAAQPLSHPYLSARKILATTTTSATEGRVVAVKLHEFGVVRAVQEVRLDVAAIAKASVRWTAPEALASAEALRQLPADVWSFGVTAWEVYARGILPYTEIAEDAEVAQVVKGNQASLGKPVQCPPAVWAVIAPCLAHKAADRPTFSKIVSGLSALVK